MLGSVTRMVQDAMYGVLLLNAIREWRIIAADAADAIVLSAPASASASARASVVAESFACETIDGSGHTAHARALATCTPTARDN